jgi:hypothetical protein
MNDLLNLPYEFQIVLVAGYLAYKIATIGRGVNHRTEDFVLQVMTYGLASRLLAIIPVELISALTPKSSRVGTVDVLDLLQVGIVTISFGVVSGMVWRKHLNRLSSRLMGRLGIYRDDHEASTMASIFSIPAPWTLLQIRCSDGRTYESNFDLIPNDVLGGRVTFNDDGISMYLTAIHEANKPETPIEWEHPEFGQRITFIPKSKIDRIEISWKKK